VQPEHALDQEVGVFEPTEQYQVRCDPGNQPTSRGTLQATLCQPQDMLAERIVGQDRSGQQQNEFRVPPAIEELASDPGAYERRRAATGGQYREKSSY
jgi:hypothetical protein